MRRWMLMLGFVALACSLPRALTPTPSSPPEPSATPTVPPTATATVEAAIPASFAASVLVDLASEPIPRDQLDTALAEASRILVEHTGIALELLEVEEGFPSSTVDEFARDYIAGASPVPNGLILFSYGDDDRARTYGGYSFWVPGPSGFHNQFVSPVAGDPHVYVAVVHWSHRFARCGYGEAEEPISEVSLDGECFNQPGTACVEHNGYSFCSNALDARYALTPTAFLSGTVVHEFLHPFGENGVYDHYGSPECLDAMGWSGGGWTFSRDESERFAGMCPNVFEAFASSRLP